MSRNYWYAKFGTLGEEYAIEMIESIGYQVLPMPVGHNTKGDLLVEKRMRVEVKAALPTKGSHGNKVRWQFSLRRHKRPVDEDLLILLCYHELDEEPIAFVIPGDQVREKLAKIDITSEPEKYAGKWSKWRGKWDMVKAILDTCKEIWEPEPIPF